MVDITSLPALLSRPRVADLLGISRASAYRFAAAGDLPTRPLGGRVFVIIAKLHAFIKGTDGSEVA